MYPEFDAEKIHKIRTTIKKMRAIGDWTGAPVRKFFRENYRLLGSIRDVQLVLSKAGKGESMIPLSFSDWIESNLNRLKAEWEKNYDHDEIKKQLRRLDKTLDKYSNVNKHSGKFEKEKNEKLNSFMRERPLSDEKIHLGRKTIKEIDFLNRWEKKNLDTKLKNLSDETGDFMDRISAIKLLERYLEEETNEANKNEAALLLENWKKSKEQEKIKLEAHINTLPG